MVEDTQKPKVVFAPASSEKEGNPVVPGHGFLPTVGSQVRMKTTSNSALAIGFYPTFKYNASGGGGVGQITAISGSRAEIRFDPQQVVIPTLSWRTALFLYAPLPPVFKIQILPSKLEGWIDMETGEVELNLSANFMFSAAGFYKVPLHVDTRLTTEAVKSTHHDEKGSRLNSQGKAVLVGVGDVQPTNSYMMNKVLQLPTDVLGLMRSQLLWEKPGQGPQ